MQLHEPALVTEHGHALLLPSFQRVCACHVPHAIDPAKQDAPNPPTHSHPTHHHARNRGKNKTLFQAYPELLAAAKGANVGVDLVTYFDEMHESVFRAATALPFAVRIACNLPLCVGLVPDCGVHLGTGLRAHPRMCLVPLLFPYNVRAHTSRPSP